MNHTSGGAAQGSAARPSSLEHPNSGCDSSVLSWSVPSREPEQNAAMHCITGRTAGLAVLALASALLLAIGPAHIAAQGSHPYMHASAWVQLTSAAAGIHEAVQHMLWVTRTSAWGCHPRIAAGPGESRTFTVTLQYVCCRLEQIWPAAACTVECNTRGHGQPLLPSATGCASCPPCCTPSDNHAYCVGAVFYAPQLPERRCLSTPAPPPGCRPQG